LSAGIPTVAFAGSGGIPDMIAECAAGTVVPRGDVSAMAEAALALANAKEAKLSARRGRLSAIAAETFSFKTYIETLIALTDPELLDVSVTVPNYNYAPHLPSRLRSIFSQWCPVREILLLDDASTDASLSVARDVAEQAGRAVTLIVNERNSGSVFAQWRRAAEAASGEFLWIAEADDESDPRFLSHLLARLKANPDTVMAFADSIAMDGDGTILSDSYKTYYKRATPGLLATDGDFAGRDFLRNCLSERNLILNVSSVLWRRSALLAALERCGETLTTFRVAGDWYLYADVLSRPGARIAYVAEPLNRHRRHQSSVTHALGARRHVDEIAEVQSFIAKLLKADPKLKRRQAAYLNEVTALLGVG
jgi:glycosyltransferase involved in cell wall biosynthesis